MALLVVLAALALGYALLRAADRKTEHRQEETALLRQLAVAPEWACVGGQGRVFYQVLCGERVVLKNGKTIAVGGVACDGGTITIRMDDQAEGDVVVIEDTGFMRARHGHRDVVGTCRLKPMVPPA